MGWIRCQQGEHIYDSSRHSSCPYCRQVDSGSIDPTVSVDEPVRDSIHSRGRREMRGPAPTQGYPEAGANEGRTVGWYDTDDEKFDPVVGWLVVASEKSRGQDFRLHAGYNKIGHDEKSDVYLAFDPKVSRTDHAAVIFEPMERIFYVQHMQGRNATYLNGKPLLQPAELKLHDQIRVGDTLLVFVPLCGDQFHWEEDEPQSGQS